MSAGDSGRTLPRSYLYCPGDRPDRLARAGSRGADALIADLEDSVVPGRKDLARAAVADWLTAGPETGELWVRVNPELLAADLGAAVTAQVTGVVLPKAEPALLAEADDLLAARERELGLASGGIGLLPLIETARGLLAAPALAAAPRVVRLGLGEADLAAELGVDAAGPQALDPLRLQAVVASAAAGIAAPVAATSRDIRDLATLRASTERALQLGFRARTAIHPAQLATINEVFTPSPGQVARAVDLVAAFSTRLRATAQG